jgi:hypothetical protein
MVKCYIIPENVFLLLQSPMAESIPPLQPMLGMVHYALQPSAVQFCELV